MNEKIRPGAKAAGADSRSLIFFYGFMTPTYGRFL